MREPVREAPPLEMFQQPADKATGIGEGGLGHEVEATDHFAGRI